MNNEREPKDPAIVLRLPRRAMRIAAIAFGAGLLLFLAVWWSGRDGAFYRVPAGIAGKTGDVVEPLPAPMAGADGASDMPDAGQPAPRLEPVAPAPMAPVAGTAPQAGIASSDTPRTAAPLAGGSTPRPLPGQSPAPAYPAAALRRGETGTVLIRVTVDASGTPVELSVEQRSGSRELDRAALDAVRGWRFQPAQRDGQAITESVVVPIEFKAQR